jgi:hypothetical protein
MSEQKTARLDGLVLVRKGLHKSTEDCSIFIDPQTAQFTYSREGNLSDKRWKSILELDRHLIALATSRARKAPKVEAYIASGRDFEKGAWRGYSSKASEKGETAFRVEGLKEDITYSNWNPVYLLPLNAPNMERIKAIREEMASLRARVAGLAKEHDHLVSLDGVKIPGLHSSEVEDKRTAVEADIAKRLAAKFAKNAEVAQERAAIEKEAHQEAGA